MSIYEQADILNIFTYDKIIEKTIEKMQEINIDTTLGEFYFENYCKKNRIAGVVYTPKDLIKFMIYEFIKEEEIIDNPYIKICDPSCGSGFFIVELYSYLKEIYLRNLEDINNKHNLNLKQDSISKHIVEKNLYGFDLDEIAIRLAIVDLFRLSGNISSNLKEKDFLLDEIEKFDIIIGNPPYIGHKEIEKDYSVEIKRKFSDVYKNKSDISFCFIKRAIESVKDNGKIVFITSRYFIEANSAREIRKYILEKGSINTIIDYYGIRPFKGIGVDPAIIEITKKNKDKLINIIRPKVIEGKVDKQFHEKLIEKNKDYREYSRNIEEIGYYNKWMLVDNREKGIINKIENRARLTLMDIGEFNQGIITGCDKAFVLDEFNIDNMRIERDLLKVWIKSTDISKKSDHESRKYLIYTNDIEDIREYPNLEKWLNKYRDKLENRRECKKSIRKWYELQWGRKKEIFEEEKIIFPYKSIKNNFVLSKGYYFSADIYSFSVQNEILSGICALLNSNIYEFYMKCVMKKLGENMYEYYPNTLKNICIPNLDFMEGKLGNSELEKYFNFTHEELKVIKNYIKQV